MVSSVVDAKKAYQSDQHEQGAEGDALRPRTNPELREEAIGKMVQTAIRLIAQHGAGKLSLVDVGRESGYSHSLPNYYFKTKKGLLLEVHSVITASSVVRIREWVKINMPGRVRPGLSNVQATLRAYLGLAATDPVRTRALHVLWSESLSSMPELLEGVRPWNRRTLDFFEHELRVGIQRREVDPKIDVPSVALMILSLLRGAVAQFIADPERVNLDSLADSAVEMLNRSIALPQQQPQSERIS